MAEYPVEAEGRVTMRADRTWRMCYEFYWDHHIIRECTDPIHHSDTKVVTLTPPGPPSYRIGVTVEGQYYVRGGGGRPIPPPPEPISSGGGWVVDASATAIEDCFGYCGI